MDSDPTKNINYTYVNFFEVCAYVSEPKLLYKHHQMLFLSAYVKNKLSFNTPLRSINVYRRDRIGAGTMNRGRVEQKVK